MKTIFISGALANKPFNGGNAWSRLSWILGFKRLGYEVLFAEQISQGACVDGAGAVTEIADSVNVAYFKVVMEQFGLERSSALICDNGQELYGPPLPELVARARTADLLFNLSGHLTLRELQSAPACKVYYDDDPGYTQFWYAGSNPEARLDGHDFFAG